MSSGPGAKEKSGLRRKPKPSGSTSSTPSALISASLFCACRMWKISSCLRSAPGASMFSSFASLARARIFISFSSERFIWSGARRRLGVRRRAWRGDLRSEAARTVGEWALAVNETRRSAHFPSRSTLVRFFLVRGEHAQNRAGLRLRVGAGGCRGRGRGRPRDSARVAVGGGARRLPPRPRPVRVLPRVRGAWVLPEGDRRRQRLRPGARDAGAVPRRRGRGQGDGDGGLARGRLGPGGARADRVLARPAAGRRREDGGRA